MNFHYSIFHFQPTTMANEDARVQTLGNFLNKPGLQHLAEEIFGNLNSDTLEHCRQINQSSNQILQNPMFWLQKFVQGGLSKKNQEDWLKAIQSVKNSDKEKCISMYCPTGQTSQSQIDEMHIRTLNSSRKDRPKVQSAFLPLFQLVCSRFLGQLQNAWLFSINNVSYSKKKNTIFWSPITLGFLH